MPSAVRAARSARDATGLMAVLKIDRSVAHIPRHAYQHLRTRMTDYALPNRV